MGELLRDPQLDPAFKDLALTLPSEAYIAEQLASVDPQRIHAARESMRGQLRDALFADWAWAFEAHQVSGGYSPDPASAGRRALANLALAMLCIDAVPRGDTAWPGRAYQRFKDAVEHDRPARRADRPARFRLRPGRACARAFPRACSRTMRWCVDKWFSMQATAPEHGRPRLRAREALLKHPDFSLANPNRARSLIGAFCMSNPAGFHRADGAGYAFWADRVLEIDAVNPQLASRIARALDRWARLAEPYRSAARAAIARVAAHPKLSSDTQEIVSRALAAS